MRCSRCGRRLSLSWRRPASGNTLRCPYCDDKASQIRKSPAEAGASGVFQTSAVLIAANGAETFYRSMEEIPHLLRSKLLKSTNSTNSATILIADRRGRQEIARVMRSLGKPQGAFGSRRNSRQPLKSLLARRAASPQKAWFTPRWKLTIFILMVMVLGLIAFLFSHSEWVLKP